MKKLIALFFTLLMAISLCACGGTSQDSEKTKETLLAEATAFSYDDLDGISGNKAFASSLVGNTYTFQGLVQSIEKDHIVVIFEVDRGDSTHSWDTSILCGNVYLTEEELLNLKPQQTIIMVGKLSSVEDTSTEMMGFTTNGTALTFEKAAVAQDRFEKTGRLRGKNENYQGAWNLQMGQSKYLKLIYFADGEDLSKYNPEFSANGDEITFSTKIIDGKFMDATIVE